MGTIHLRYRYLCGGALLAIGFGLVAGQPVTAAPLGLGASAIPAAAEDSSLVTEVAVRGGGRVGVGRVGVGRVGVGRVGVGRVGWRGARVAGLGWGRGWGWRRAAWWGAPAVGAAAIGAAAAAPFYGPGYAGAGYGAGYPGAGYGYGAGYAGTGYDYGAQAAAAPRSSNYPVAPIGQPFIVNQSTGRWCRVETGGNVWCWTP
jgi:hypothetical protein